MPSAPEARVLATVGREAAAALADIRTAIRQPSVSRTGEGLQAMADWVSAYLAELGASVRQFPGQKAPIVEGVLGNDPGQPMLLLYDLYDVQPAAGQPGWSALPFDAEILAGPDGRNRLVGRGAFNSKGPLVGTLATLRCFRHASVPIPCNIRFLFEGEEEIGSPSLPAYIKANHAVLAACDAAFIPYFGTNSRGQTVLRLGFKGLALLEFRVDGGEWGGPARGDIHALHGAMVASPSWELVRALATLVDGEGRFAPDGLDALVPRPDPADLALVAAEAERFDLARHAADLGVARLAKDAPARELLTDWMFACTLNIDALSAGRIEAGSDGDDAATLIPRTARCFADLRVVPGVTPDALLRLIRAHLDRRGFRHVQVKLRSAYPASRATTGTPVVRALIDACREHSGDLHVWPIHAGAAPMHVFSDVIGIPYAFGGVGHGGGGARTGRVYPGGRHRAVHALDRHFPVPLRRCPEREPREDAVFKLMIGRRALLAGAPALLLASRARASDKQNEITIVQTTDANSLDPAFRGDTVTGNVQRHIFDTLMVRNPDLTLAPSLAESVEQTGKTEWVLHLRKGVTFSNGEPFDAAAVKFSIDRAKNPELKAPTRGWWMPFKIVEVVDPHTARIITATPDPLFQARLSLFQPVPPKYLAEGGGHHFRPETDRYRSVSPGGVVPQ